MAKEIDLIGYSKGVDDFISNGMSMQRTIPYSGDDTRVHHEQKLLPGLSVGGGDVAAYDGPFAAKRGQNYSYGYGPDFSKEIIINGGRVYAGTNIVDCKGLLYETVSSVPCYFVVRVYYMEQGYHADILVYDAIPVPTDNFWYKVVAFLDADNILHQWWQGGDLEIGGRCV